MSKIYLVCGCPGQGKSTWIESRKTCTAAHISRDYIRFLLLSEDEDYFSREKDVLAMFKFNVEQRLSMNEDEIYVDATFLTPNSRKWVLELAHRYGATITAVSFERPLEWCLTCNAKREGRSFVPESAIRKMSLQYDAPTNDEGFDDIIIIAKEPEDENI